jgi:glycopeptide antibiotics resistance protein
MLEQHPRSPALRRWCSLVALLALALFPYGWLLEIWPDLDRAIGWAFATVQAHAVAHTITFFALGLALLAAFPALRARPLHYLGLVLLLGIAQEAFQLLYKQRAIVVDDVRDLIPDLAGCVIAFLVVRWLARHDDAPVVVGRR